MLQQIARIFGVAASVLALLLLAACGGGGGSPGATPGTGALSVGGLTAVSLQVGASTLNPVRVTGGTPPYTVASSNEAVARGWFGADNHLTMGGSNAGTATLVVRDRAGATVSLAVTVAPSVQLSSTAPAAFNLGVTELRNFSVAGGVAPYTITGSNDAVAVVSNLGNGNWSIQGRALGTVNVLIRDAAGAELTRAVTVAAVAPLSSTAPAAFTLGVTELRNFSVAGGVAHYTITGSNDAVAVVSNLGNGNWSIQGRALGTVNVLIRDAAGAELTRAVTVAAAVPLSSTAPAAFTLGVTELRNFSVSGGVAPYTITGSNDAVAAVNNLGGGNWSIQGRALGAVNVVIRDATGAELTRAVTVATVSPLSSTAPAAFTLTVAEQRSFSVAGGVAPYTITGNNDAIATVSNLGGGNWSIQGRALGAVNVVIRDATGAELTRAVTVAAAVPLSSTAPAAFTLGMAEQRSFIVSGGVAPYTITGSNDAIAAVVNQGGGNWSIQGLALGTLNVVIRDAAGAELTRAVTVAALAPLSSTAPAAFTLGVTEQRSFIVSGGVAPYTITGSNDAIAVVSNLGNGNWSIQGRALGAVNVVIRDATGAELTRAVTVATVVPLSSTAPAAFTLTVAEQRSFSVAGGVAPYTITGSNDAIAAVVNEGGGNWSIQGRALGAVNVVIRDATGAELTRAVTVVAVAPLSSTAPAAFTLGMAEQRSFSVSGGVAPYTITGSNDAVAAVVSHLGGGIWTIQGLALGTLNVVIRDAAGAELTRAVTVAAVAPLSSTAPVAFTLGVTEQRSFIVSGGVAPYTITGSNDAIAAVVNEGGGNWSIRGLAVGTVNVVIRDATGALLTRAVTVQTLPFAVSSSSLTLPIDIPAIVTLTGGRPPYSVLGGIPAALTVTPVPGVANEFQIVGTLVSNNLDIVFADAVDQTVRTSVTITAATTGVRLSPSALIISELGDNTTQPIRLTVFGAVGPFTVFSSHISLLQPSIVAYPAGAASIEIVTGLNGFRCVDLPEVDVTITVVDSTRSVGTSVITIQNRIQDPPTGVTLPCPQP